MRFGKNIVIQAPLSQPVLKVDLMVDMEFHKMTGPEVTIDKETQFGSNKVDSRLGCSCNSM